MSLDGAELRMLAYNGSVPGASLHIDPGSDITVQVTNDGDASATVDWHGLRLDNRHNGVPNEAQAPIPIGRTFTCRLRVPWRRFPWYHPTDLPVMHRLGLYPSSSRTRALSAGPRAFFLTSLVAQRDAGQGDGRFGQSFTAAPWRPGPVGVGSAAAFSGMAVCRVLDMPIIQGRRLSPVRI